MENGQVERKKKQHVKWKSGERNKKQHGLQKTRSQMGASQTTLGR